MNVYLFNVLLVLIGIPLDEFLKSNENVSSTSFLNLDESTFQTVNSFNAGYTKILTPFYIPVIIIPEKGLPTPFREPSRVITTYYPHKPLEVTSNIKEEFLVKKEFFFNKGFAFETLFLLFFFFIIYNIKKKKQQKQNKKKSERKVAIEKQVFCKNNDSNFNTKFFE